jgi:hypothetical protein
MDLKHIIPQQRRRSAGPSLDIQYSVDRSNVPRVGPTPTFTRASSGTFVNENRRIVGKTTSTTSLNPANVAVGGVAVFAVPSGSVVGWLNDSVVSVMVDSDGNDQVDAQAHVTGTLLHKTDTAITLLVTSKVGTATVSSWFVSYRGQRITHDPVTGMCLGTWIEQTRTNLLLQSENFGTTWTNDVGLVAISINQTTSPSGLVDADKISENTTVSNRRIAIQGASFASGTTYTLSCFVKAAERDFVQLRFGSAFGGQFQNFVIGGVNAGTIGSGSGATSSIQAYPNGWYRCSITAASASTGSSNVTIGPQISSTALGWAPYVGTIGSGIFVWGAQLEAGLNATSYIPTSAVSTARAQDLHTITGANFSYMYNQSSGTVFCSHAMSSFNGSHGVYGITAPSRPEAGISVTRGISTIVTGVYSSPPNYDSQASFSSSVAASGQIKSAIAVRTDDFANSVNGSISTDSSGTLNPIMDRFVIGATGNTSGPQVGNNIFSAIRYYRDRLPNAELQTLTSTVSETIVYNGVAIWYNGEGLIETS